jgi:hypothetical protein
MYIRDSEWPIYVRTKFEQNVRFYSEVLQITSEIKCEDDKTENIQ